MKRILVTNDDGIDSNGIKTLAESLSKIGEVIVVAPASDMTAVSHSLTLNRPLRVEQRSDNFYSIDGTPTDCVMMGINLIMKDAPPDLVVSGINKGANLGDDVHYSGTVAGAMEASMYSIPAIAISLFGRDGYNFIYAAEFASEVAGKVLIEGLPKGTLLNVNVPPGPIKGAVVTKQGTKVARTRIIEGIDPRKRRYYWIGQDFVSWEQEPGADFLAVRKGFVSITPLRNDLTDHAHLLDLQKWDEKWMRGDSEEFMRLEGRMEKK